MKVWFDIIRLEVDGGEKLITSQKSVRAQICSWRVLQNFGKPDYKQVIDQMRTQLASVIA